MANQWGGAGALNKRAVAPIERERNPELLAPDIASLSECERLGKPHAKADLRIGDGLYSRLEFGTVN
jgi:hypothetical protein